MHRPFGTTSRSLSDYSTQRANVRAALRQSHSMPYGGCDSIWTPAPLQRWAVTIAWIGCASCATHAWWPCCGTVARRGADLLRLTWGHVYAQRRDRLLSDSWLSNSDAGLPSGALITADVLKTAKRHRPLTIVVPTQAEAGDRHCAVVHLRELFAAKRAMGEPVTDPIFCRYRTVQSPRFC